MEIKRISSLDMFPEWMRDSRDLRVFTTLIDLLVTEVMIKTYQLQEVYNTELTSEEQISLIENVVDMQDNLKLKLTIEQKRILLKYYNKMYKYRGSVKGLIWAIKLYNLLTFNNNTNPLEYERDIKITKTLNNKKVISKQTDIHIYDIELLKLLIRTVISPDYMLKLDI